MHAHDASQGLVSLMHTPVSRTSARVIPSCLTDPGRPEPIMCFWGLWVQKRQFSRAGSVLAGCRWFVGCWTPWSLWAVHAPSSVFSEEETKELFQSSRFCLVGTRLAEYQVADRAGCWGQSWLWARIQSLLGDLEINVAEQINPKIFSHLYVLIMLMSINQKL